MCVKGMFSSYTSVLHTSNPDCGPRSERSHSSSIHYMSCILVISHISFPVLFLESMVIESLALLDLYMWPLTAGETVYCKKRLQPIRRPRGNTKDQFCICWWTGATGERHTFTRIVEWDVTKSRVSISCRLYQTKLKLNCASLMLAWGNIHLKLFI